MLEKKKEFQNQMMIIVYHRFYFAHKRDSQSENCLSPWELALAPSQYYVLKMDQQESFIKFYCINKLSLAFFANKKNNPNFESLQKIFTN